MRHRAWSQTVQKQYDIARAFSSNWKKPEKILIPYALKSIPLLIELFSYYRTIMKIF